MLLRWVTGLWKRLFGGWDDHEWFYYNHCGFDPTIPAHQRWAVRMTDKQKPPETPGEELVPQHSYSVMLEDKFGQTAEDMAFTTMMLDKAQAVLEQFERELRTRSCGDFWHGMIKNRRLDFFHNFRAVGSEPLEGSADIDDEQEREKFLR
ncbi:MAG: hypothetical protein M3R04_03350 [bacterium]|nr:hypothetical protein [bacterium]